MALQARQRLTDSRTKCRRKREYIFNTYKAAQLMQPRANHAVASHANENDPSSVLATASEAESSSELSERAFPQDNPLELDTTQTNALIDIAVELGSQPSTVALTFIQSCFAKFHSLSESEVRTRVDNPTSAFKRQKLWCPDP
jgi:hypothetical protein